MKKTLLTAVVVVAPAIVLLVFSVVVHPQWSQVSANSDHMPIAVPTTDFVAPAYTQQRSALAQSQSQLPVPSSSVSGDTTGIYYVHVTPDSYFKLRGSYVQFSGSHFYPNESVTVKNQGTIVDTLHADTAGMFTTGWYKVPYTTMKDIFVFTGTVSNIPYPVTITVGGAQPWVMLSTYYAGVGTPLIVGGHGFGSNESVTVSFDGVSQGTVQSNYRGDFTLTTIVPGGGQGTRMIAATGLNTGMTAEASFSQAY